MKPRVESVEENDQRCSYLYHLYNDKKNEKKTFQFRMLLIIKGELRHKPKLKN